MTTKIQTKRKLGKYEILRTYATKDVVTMSLDSRYGQEIVEKINHFSFIDPSRRLALLVDPLVDKIPANLGVYVSRDTGSGIVVRTNRDSISDNTALTIYQRNAEKIKDDFKLLEEILQ